MDKGLFSALASVSGMVVTGFFGYLVAKQNNKKELVVNDRQSLSADEKNFRNDLLIEITSYREEVKRLRVEMEALIIVNAELKAENKILANKVDELTHELRKFYTNSDKKR